MKLQPTDFDAFFRKPISKEGFTIKESLRGSGQATDQPDGTQLVKLDIARRSPQTPRVYKSRGPGQPGVPLPGVERA